MSEDLFEKIVNDLKSIPESLPLSINLTRVNEPFLDKRIFEFADFINQELPRAELIFFSNASPLNGNNLEKLLMLKNVQRLNISFNDHRAGEYEKTMKLPFERTLRHVKHIHEMKVAGEIPFQISLSRVGDRSSTDRDFVEWGEKSFSAFKIISTPRSSWLSQNNNKKNLFDIPDLGCTQWFNLDFLSNGKHAFCCIDDEGEFGYGNVKHTQALDIYNHPKNLWIRSECSSRYELSICSKCSLFA